jgi:Asp/Glu/hydantoin racemase
MFKVTLFATTILKRQLEMEWVTFADTGTGAIEQVKDSFAADLLLLEKIKFQVEKSVDPVLVSIKEK